ncbi:hypothetical protein AB0F16_25985 [Streptomyces tanashiensis]|uniref:hypothetical protein n=1 Tax=Streptomyces tanashiensis TaxID=67367 RepID=UPI0033D4501A
MNRHAIPYAAASPACCCPVQACGGIIPNPDCPDHGARRNPAMGWHWEDACPALLEPGPHCAQGHPLPADAVPLTRDPEDWDDTCRCNPA